MIQNRNGYTIVELLIAMTMTLIVLGAMMAAFAWGSQKMHTGRAGVDLISKLQTATELLRNDLEQISVQAKPHHFVPTPPSGYLEIVEGNRRDTNAEDLKVNQLSGGDNSYLGDDDDVIAFTMKATDEPFVGVGNGLTESHYAQVVWFVADRRLYRKIVLVRPDLGLQVNDRNVRKSLHSLGYRGQRLGHKNGRDPHTSFLQRGELLSQCEQSDIVLSNVIGFDIKVFEPNALTYSVRADAMPNAPIVGVISPSDIGARSGIGQNLLGAVSRGAFVDLGSRAASPQGEPPVLLGPPHRRYHESVYDTGTSQYDNDQVNDRGNNGIDNRPYFGVGEPNGVIDDAEEKTSLPPYNVPLRGLQISIRVVEPNTKQVRQLSVVKSFAAQ